MSWTDFGPYTIAIINTIAVILSIYWNQKNKVKIQQTNNIISKLEKGNETLNNGLASINKEIGIGTEVSARSVIAKKYEIDEIRKQTGKLANQVEELKSTRLENKNKRVSEIIYKQIEILSANIDKFKVSQYYGENYVPPNRSEYYGIKGLQYLNHHLKSVNYLYIQLENKELELLKNSENLKTDFNVRSSDNFQRFKNSFRISEHAIFNSSNLSMVIEKYLNSWEILDVYYPESKSEKTDLAQLILINSTKILKELIDNYLKYLNIKLTYLDITLYEEQMINDLKKLSELEKKWLIR